MNLGRVKDVDSLLRDHVIRFETVAMCRDGREEHRNLLARLPPAAQAPPCACLNEEDVLSVEIANIVHLELPLSNWFESGLGSSEI